MTPFGTKVREFRSQRGISLKKMAADMGVTSAYFSALEHGHRGRPVTGLIQQISGYFDLSWEESEDLERLAQLSHPRIVVDTSGLTPQATELANLLAQSIGDLDEDAIEWVLHEIRGRMGAKERGGPTH
ncbi:MAG: helix-turn-helix transcriptional regulator [Alphaproteobacteria bacterium]|nr:helix-turn-helix transcriptional regulator [Alphaproteobacteria bacterium]